ncbi:hypothetical protein KJ885_01265 [Patescibacteria group bacterium]|nr:hypothetical protein [Patescibacteria group bacterium]
MNLQELLNNRRIKKIDASADIAKAKLKQAYKSYKFVQLHLRPPGFEEQLYSQLYDSARLAGEALLAFNGYKVMNKKGAHEATFVATKNLLAEKIKEEFGRISKMRRKRNDIEYDIGVISESELKQSIKDIKILLDHINKKII